MSVFYQCTGKQALYLNLFCLLFCKTKIIPLKLIVIDARTNFVKDLYHQLHSKVMKQLSQAYMKRIVFLSIVYNNG